jgi:hypothetical protein
MGASAFKPMSVTMNIWANRDTPFPSRIPRIELLDDLLLFVEEDSARLIAAKVDTALYDWENVRVAIEFDHDSKKGMIDVVMYNHKIV